MVRMISIHEYDLRPGSGAERFEQAFRAAEARGLFELPGLTAPSFREGREGRKAGRLSIVHFGLALCVAALSASGCAHAAAKTTPDMPKRRHRS